MEISGNGDLFRNTFYQNQLFPQDFNVSWITSSNFIFTIEISNVKGASCWK